MPARLVYSPKIFAFTRNAQGELYNISPYIVSGEIQRNINQASTATLVLRNPDKIFTTPKNGIAFHPQDPITIYMERLAGFPVRVFTGYLDATPYLQLQPAVIQLQASCTLKRLLYTYFDPSLPYMISFFEQYGWINTGQGSIMNLGVANAKNLKQSHDTLGEHSISRLLWGILYDIGQWDDTDIWIEPLPQGTNGIVQRMLRLMQQFDAADTEAAYYLENIFSSVIGAGSQGSGGTGGSLNTSLQGNDNIQEAFNYLCNNGYTPAAAAGVVGNWMYESTGGAGLDPQALESRGNTSNVSAADANNAKIGYGIAQWTPPSKLIDWCNNHQPKLDYSELSSQLAYAVIDMRKNYSTLVSQLNACTTPTDASNLYLTEYERPNDPAATRSTRAQLAQQVYNAYAKGAGGTSDPSKPGTNKSSKTTKTKFDPWGNLQKNPFGNPFSGAPAPSFETALAQQSSSSSSSDGSQAKNRYNAIIQAANAIDNKKYPYIWGGGHAQAGTPSAGTPNRNGTGAVGVGYDCSGSVAAVLYAAGIYEGSVGTDASLVQSLVASGKLVRGVDNSSTSITIWDNPGQHVFMRIGGVNGKYWGTSDNQGTGNAAGGPGWLSSGNASNAVPSGFIPYHIPEGILKQPATYRLSISPGTTKIGDGSGGNGVSDASGNMGLTSSAAFTGQLAFPSIEDSIVAILLGGEGKGLMHDQQLLPFVQQVAQASLRSFMSLPDGSFYAFYPDYFGEFGHHDPYWMIDDIEITSGTISISDDALATHVYAVGDNTWPIDDAMLNQLFSAGTITVFNAFDTKSGGKILTDKTPANGEQVILDSGEALQFVKRYGARPIVQEYPMVRSGIFEMLMAYQLFTEAWSNQFLSTFTFTFMPELFPGGKVGFPSHGLMMYVNSVTHIFDYTTGFETIAQLSSPSVMSGYNAEDCGLPPNMVAALAEPVKPTTSNSKSHKEVNQTTKKKKPNPNYSGHNVKYNRG